MKIKFNWHDYLWNPYSGISSEINEEIEDCSSIKMIKDLQLDEEGLNYPNLIKGTKRILVNPNIDLFNSDILKYNKLNIIIEILDVVKSNRYHQFMIITSNFDKSIFESFNWPENVIITRDAYDYYNDDVFNLSWDICLDRFNTKNFRGQFYLLFRFCANNGYPLSMEGYNKVIIDLNHHKLNPWELNWINSILAQSIEDGCNFTLVIESD